MAELDFSFTTTIDFSVPVTDHAFVLRCLPATRDNQTVQCSLKLAPDAPFAMQVDSFGNNLVVSRIDEPHASLTYHVTGSASVEDPLSTAPAKKVTHPHYLFPSPQATATNEMRMWLNEAGFSKDDFATLDENTLIQRISLLNTSLHEYMEYVPGSTHVLTTAATSFNQRAGVCQDFAHILICLLRSLEIPARYASGFTVGEGATHAWTQAFINGRWLGFDPTRNKVCDDTYLVCAVGRDWSDCPVERGVFIGNANQTQTVFMEVVQK